MMYFTGCPQEGLRECEEAAPIFVELHKARAEDRCDDVVRLADQVQESCGKCPHAAADKADALGRLGQHDTAMQVVDGLLAGGLGDHPLVADQKGTLLALAGDIDAAIPWYEKSLAIAPDLHPPNCHLASTYFLLGKPEEALPYAKRARASAPTEDGAAGILIHVLAELDMREELAEALSQVGQVEWRHSAFVVAVAGAFRKLSDTDSAAEWCRKALGMDPEDDEALCMLARILYCGKGEYHPALQVFSRLRDVDATHARASMLAAARHMADERADPRHAIDVLVEACIYFPDDDELREYRGHLMDRLVGNVEALARETDVWKRRFQAESDDHSSLRRAVQELHQASEPGLPLGIALVEGEGQSIEFMETYPQNAHDLAKEIAAFSTSNDGTIFLGVTDDGEVVGIPDLDAIAQRDALKQRVSGITSGVVRPSVNVSVSFVPYKGKTVVRVFVPKGARPVYWVRDVPYLRHLDKSRPAKPDEVEALILQGRKPVTAP